MPEDVLNISFVEFSKVNEFRCDKSALELLLLLKDKVSFPNAVNKLGLDEREALDSLKYLESQGVLTLNQPGNGTVSSKSRKILWRGAKKDVNVPEKNNNHSSPEKKSEFIDKSLFAFLDTTFSMALGPIAEVVIEDEISDMGEKKDKFPSYRFAELVGFLAHHIPRDDKKLEFQKLMMEKIKELG